MAPVRSSSAAALGAMLASATGSPTPFSDSALRTRTRVPPHASVPKISAMETSNETEVEASTERRSSSLTCSRSQCSSATVLRCSICTPLGRPVEPEV